MPARTRQTKKDEEGTRLVIVMPTAGYATKLRRVIKNVSRAGVRGEAVTTTFEIRVREIPHEKVPQKDASGVIPQNAIGKVEIIQTMLTKTNAIAVR